MVLRRIARSWLCLITVLLICSLLSIPPPVVTTAAGVVTVTNTSDTVNGTTTNIAALIANPGPDGISFREALMAVNNTGPGNTINFDLPYGSTITGSSTWTLSASNTTIDGQSTTLDGIPRIVLNGPSSVPSLIITSGYNSIKHLAITGITFSGDNAGHNVVANSYIGTDIEGRTARPRQISGLQIVHEAHHTTVIGNIIAGNTSNVTNILLNGITIDSGAHDNLITGNRIGVNIDGTLLPNDTGIYIGNGTANNIIGGVSSGSDCLAPCNVIVGNKLHGIYLTATSSNTIQGNFIASNWDSGIWLSNGTTGNLIGGSQRTWTACDGTCNVISANGKNGIALEGSGNRDNRVQGNYLGLTPNGLSAAPNNWGIWIANGAKQNRIGGTLSGIDCTGDCNIISGNRSTGVLIQDSGTISNTLQGNYIGVNPAGTGVFANGGIGVTLASGATGNLIGGLRTSTACDGPCNVIAGNSGVGIQIQSSGTNGNLVQGNLVGLAPSGTAAMANGSAGITLLAGASENVIGGTRTGVPCDGPCNVIAGNRGNGIVVQGTDISPDASQPAPDSPVLSIAPAAGPVDSQGMRVSPQSQLSTSAAPQASATTGNIIQGNHIGVSASDIFTIPNGTGHSAVVVSFGATQTTIGGNRAPGDCQGPCNLIRSSTGSGVSLLGTTTRGITIRGNAIYESAFLGIDRGGDGVTLNGLDQQVNGATNDGMPTPQSVTADYDGTQTTITGIISVTHPSQATIDIYANSQANEAGLYEGQHYLGNTTPDSSGAFTLTVAGALPYGNPHLTATATGATGSTSEFSIRMPLIFVHGVAASQLVDTADGDELWPGLFANSDRLSLLPEDHPVATIIATSPLRYIGFSGASNTPPSPLLSSAQIVYGPFLDMLQSFTGAIHGDYRLYNDHSDPVLRTTAGCDLTQASDAPTLFAFAYDWRLSNADNAARMKDFMGCVHRFYPGARVNVVTHSMGSILARRYILDNPSDNAVQRLITIGAPWLGAAKVLYAIETGDFVPIIGKNATKKIILSAASAHQLLPSQAYYDLAADLNGATPGTITATLTSPLVEAGWDLNGNGVAFEGYTYSEYMKVVNSRYARSGITPPATTADTFHSFSNTGGDRQDDWSNDTTGVTYYHFFGTQSGNTSIGRVRAVSRLSCIPLLTCWTKQVFETVLTRGDGTVSQLSAQRIGPHLNYNAPDAKLFRVCATSTASNELAEHTGMTRNPDVVSRLLLLLETGHASDIPGCFATTPPPPTLAPGDQITAAAEPAIQPYYYVSINGGTNVVVSDTLGHSTAPITGTMRGEVPGVFTYQQGEDAELIALATDGVYTVTFQTTSQPMMIEVTTGTYITASQATRYLDLVLPANRTAILTFSPQGVAGLRYDNDGDGSFETPVTPTVSLSGAQANDLQEPDISVTTASQGQQLQVTITASDAGTGVKAVYYSLDGSQFQPYSGAILVDRQQASISVFADDNAGNRAFGTYPLTPTSQNTNIYLPLTVRQYSAGW